jgi:NADH:ubiquinone oxidoreductase subunit K
VIALGALVAAAGLAIVVWGFRRRPNVERRRLESLGRVDSHREVFRG